MYKKLLLLITSVACLTASDMVLDELQLDESFLEAIDEATSIATKTKLNIDEVPAFITILRHDKLVKYGFNDLYESLSIIPGVELSIEASGAKQIIFRGVKEKGKVKLLIDGVAINNSYRGSIYYYLNFPVELIERIEVIRGPGAVIYGSNAISGVINIVTANKDSKLFTSYGSYNSKKGGFAQTYELDKYQLSFDGYYQTSDKSIKAGPDKGGNYGESNEKFDDYSIGLSLKFDNLSFISRVKNSQDGTAFGMSNYLENTLDKDGNINKSIFAQLLYQDDIKDDIKYTFKLGYNNYFQRIEARFLPHPNKGDLIMASKYKENKYNSGFELFINSFENHEILAGIEYEKTELADNYLNSYWETTPDTSYLPTNTILKSGINRDIFSAFLNDRVNITQNLDATVGLRADKYSDFGNAISPRAALVYQQNDKINYKMMYSKAFRAPSFVELYNSIIGVSVGNDTLDKEESDTIESGVIYKYSPLSLVRVNIYHTKINNIIYRDAITKKYTQKGYQKFKGIETQWIHTIDSKSELNLNISYVEGKDEDGVKINDIAPITGNLGYSHIFSNRLISSSLLKYVGERKRSIDDVREDLDSYTTVDQSLTYNYKNYQTVFSIKNIFNDKVYYPAIPNTYINDYPRDGRTFWIKLSMSF